MEEVGVCQAADVVDVATSPTPVLTASPSVAAHQESICLESTTSTVPAPQSVPNRIKGWRGQFTKWLFAATKLLVVFEVLCLLNDVKKSQRCEF